MRFRARGRSGPADSVSYIQHCGGENPGPTVEEMFDQLMKGQSSILTELSDIRNRLTATENTVTLLNSRWTELDKVLHDVREKSSQIQTLQDKVLSLENVIEQQTNKITDLEDRSRRSNLVVYGIKDQADESDQVLRAQVIDNVFTKILKQPSTSVARIHRLGKRVGNRPVIVYFQDFLEKEAILRSASKLKGTDIFIQNDFSQSTLRKRKLLWQSAKADKANGKSVSLISDKLKIDGVTYTWDDTRQQRIAMSSRVTRVEPLPGTAHMASANKVAPAEP